MLTSIGIIRYLYFLKDYIYQRLKTFLHTRTVETKNIWLPYCLIPCLSHSSRGNNNQRALWRLFTGSLVECYSRIHLAFYFNLHNLHWCFQLTPLRIKSFAEASPYWYKIFLCSHRCTVDNWFVNLVTMYFYHE